MSAKGKPQGSVDVTCASAEQAEMMKLVVQHEAALRGVTMGQAFAQLVLEAAKGRRYPDEVAQLMRGI